MLDEEIATTNRGDDLDACSLCDIVIEQPNLEYKNKVPTCFSCIGIEDQEKEQSQQIRVSSTTSTVMQLPEQPVIRQDLPDGLVEAFLLQ